MENFTTLLPSPYRSAGTPLKRERSPSTPTKPRKRARIEPEAALVPDAIPKTPQLAWSKTRQALCDALPFFKSHNGGTYTSGKKILGLLVGGFPEPRDYFGRDIIITTMGGGREQNNDGKWIRVSTNKTYEQLSSWTEALQQQRPIGVIIDKKHPAFERIDLSLIDTPDRSKVSYVVLAFFFVTKIWQEPVQPDGLGKPYTVSKLMLQRIDTEETPVYLKDASTNRPLTNHAIPCPEGECKTCRQKSPRVFNIDTFVCLNQKCKTFFKSESNGEKLDTRALEYSPRLLGSLQTYHGDKNAIPQLFQPAPTVDKDGFGTEKALRSGMTCPRCGACSRRTTWDGWNCENCPFSSKAFPTPYPLDKVKEEAAQRISKIKSPSFRDDHTTIMIDHSEVEKKPSRVEGQSTITEYIFRNDNNEVIGTLVHSRPSDALKASPNGADNLFMEIQANDIGLTRYASRCRGSVAEVMTRHFIGNWGFPYQFGVKVPTKPLEGAPEPVLKAMAQLGYYGKQAVESSQRTATKDRYASVDGSTMMKPWTPYNEQLILGYMEDDHILWHDDGESQLSGTITTICLGSPAEMHLRMKDKKKVNLKVQLLHGDSVTMCDTQLQRFTDHQVVPKGIRRFALTGRAINPEYYDGAKGRRMLKDLYDLTPEEAREAGKLPPAAAQFSYPGPSITTAGPYGE